jgi:hypothetical protein
MDGTQPFPRGKAVTTITKFVRYSELPNFGVPKFSCKHFLDLQKRGLFPRARQLTPGRIAWVEDEIVEWLATRPVALAAMGPLVEDPPCAKARLRRGPGAAGSAKLGGAR